MTKFRKQLLGTKKSFDIYCVSYEFFSIGPKRLMQPICEKKAMIRKEKSFWPFFRFIEFKKAQRTFFEV